MIVSDNFLVVATCLSIVVSSFYLLIRYPEIFFVLFLLAGVYKADPRLQFLQNYLDLTIAFGLLSIISLIIVKLKANLINFVIAVPSKSILIGYFYIAFLAILSLTYGSVTPYGIEKSARFLTITSLAFFLPFFLFKNRNPTKNFGAITRFFAVFVFLALAIVISIVTSDLAPGKIDFEDAFGGTYIVAGRTIGTALIILVFYFWDISRNKIQYLTYLCIIAFMIFGMFVTGGRAPLIGLFISFFAVYCSKFLELLRTKKKSGETIIKFAAILLVVLFLLIKYSDYFSTLFYRLGLFQSADKGSVFITAISERLELTKFAFEAMFKFPLGLGFGGFSLWYNGGATGIQYLYPHNLFLELGAEGGMLGLFAILLLVIKSFLTVLSKRRPSQLQHQALKDTLLGLLVFMVFNATVSGALNDERVLFALIGLIDAIRKSCNPIQVIEESKI